MLSESCPCLNCGSLGMLVFHRLNQVPVHSVLLLPTREAALNYTRGDIALGFCQNCGFVSNVAYDPSLQEYSQQCEETQGYSPTFGAFHRRLAQRLIDRYDVRGKQIIEIGCGKGEFISALCEMGDNRGIGFDPAYVPERSLAGAQERVTFITDFYSDKYAHITGDLIVCKMTLEHIQHPYHFVSTIRRAIGEREDSVVFFQVPDVTRVLREVAFWDIYYEHCSYFNPASLASLFRRAGFDVLDLWRDYDDQYLMIEARAGIGSWPARLVEEIDLGEVARDVAYFAMAYEKRLAAWREYLDDAWASRRRVVLWGAGSKGVAFLTTLGMRDGIDYVVDINPHKHHTFMAGTGQEIVEPGFLRDYRPDAVVIMNPIYRQEIRQSLEEMNLHPELMATSDI